MKFLLAWYRAWKKFHHPVIYRIIALFVLSLIATRVFWHSGFPYTHDGENHLARFANYFIALREGQFPPRFAPHLFAGYGFPVFQYNYPLANIFAVPLIALKQNPEFVYAVEALAATFILASSWFFFLRRRFTESASWVGVVAVLFSSVVQSNLFYRGNIGELWAMAFASLWLLVWELRGKKRYLSQIVLLAIVLACFLLSHNVIAVFLSPFLLLWQGITARTRKDLWLAVFSWLLASGLVVWFWLPAVTELSLVVLSNDSLASQAVEHSISLGQIFFSPLRFGFSRPGVLDNLGWGWGIPIVAFLWLGLGQLLRTEWFYWKPQYLDEEKRKRVFFIGLFILGCFMSSNLSTFLWKSVQLLAVMQFPWRWLSFSLLAVPYLSALVYSQSGRLGRKFFLFVFLVWFFMLSRLVPADRFHKDALSYRVFPHTSLTRNENRPKTLVSETLPSWEPGPEILEGAASEVKVLRWTGSVHEYTIHPKETLLVREKTVYFPGWETRVGTQSVEQIFTDSTGGLVAYYVPASEGEVRVKSSFTHRTPIRLISELLFLTSVLIGVGLLLWENVLGRKK
jgi:hypothetical protein